MEFNATFIATIITFLLFVFLMNKILYAPILNIMEERKRFIDENYETAANHSAKAESLSAEKEKKLNEAKDSARGKYLETLDGFKKQKADKVQEAQNNASDELNRSKEELETVSNEVKSGLKNKMTDLANDIVEKVLGYRSEVQGFDNEAVDKVLWGE